MFKELLSTTIYISLIMKTYGKLWKPEILCGGGKLEVTVKQQNQSKVLCFMVHEPHNSKIKAVIQNWVHGLGFKLKPISASPQHKFTLWESYSQGQKRPDRKGTANVSSVLGLWVPSTWFPKVTFGSGIQLIHKCFDQIIDFIHCLL